MQNEREILSSPWILVDLFILYVVWSLLGVVLEGLYTRFTLGEWQTHVVSMIGPFCIIYGFGACFIYVASFILQDCNLPVRFLAFAAIGTLFELLCGLLLLYGLGMKAWDYHGYFLEYKDVICFRMFIVWGLLGVAFSMVCPALSSVLAKLHRQPFGIIAAVLSAVLVVDLIFTGVCIVRWKDRRKGIEASSAVGKYIDTKYPDDYMQNRFIEWRFV